MKSKSLWPTIAEVLRPKAEDPVHILKTQIEVGNKQFPGLNAVLNKGDDVDYLFCIDHTLPIFGLTLSKTEWYPVTIKLTTQKLFQVNDATELCNCVRDILNSDNVVLSIYNTIRRK